MTQVKVALRDIKPGLRFYVRGADSPEWVVMHVDNERKVVGCNPWKTAFSFEYLLDCTYTYVNEPKKEGIWYSVKDCLPDPGVMVLAYSSLAKAHTAMLSDVGIGLQWIDLRVGNYSYIDESLITHWAHMPILPKVE